MILVTGANGFIGSAMVWQLNQMGLNDIVAVDTIPRSTHDLLKNRTIKKFLLKDEIWNFLQSHEGAQIQWIIHMGACSATTETNWDFLQENNVDYSKRLFQWCAEHQKSLIYASSAATYGAGENGFTDTFDSEKLKPLNLYGESKVLVDRWAVKQTRTPKNWYALKFFNVFGPNEYFKGPMASVAYKAYHQIQKTGRMGLFRSHHPDYKDGEQLRDFVYVKDVTRWMAELMDKKPANGIYNMGFGTARTWLDLTGATFQASDRPSQIDWLDVPANIRDQYQYFTEANMQKWQGAGLSQPQWPLEKAVADYVKNYLSHQDAIL